MSRGVKSCSSRGLFVKARFYLLVTFISKWKSCLKESREETFEGFKKSSVQCAEAKSGKSKKDPPVCLRSFSANSLPWFKFHTLLSIYIFINFFESPIILPAAAILKKIINFKFHENCWILKSISVFTSWNLALSCYWFEEVDISRHMPYGF